MDTTFWGCGRRWYTYYDEHDDLHIVLRDTSCPWWRWWPAWLWGLVYRYRWI